MSSQRERKNHALFVCCSKTKDVGAGVAGLFKTWQPADLKGGDPAVANNESVMPQIKVFLISLSNQKGTLMQHQAWQDTT
eukprot:5379850-Amphidinium_carterae.1